MIEAVPFEQPPAAPNILNGPEIAFVSWDHSIGNTALAVEAIRDCDVVAIEIGRPELDSQQAADERAEFDALATRYIGHDMPGHEKADARQQLQQLGHSVITAILDNLQDSGKHIVTIDFDRSGENGTRTTQAAHIATGLPHDIYLEPTGKTIQKLLRYSQLSATSSKVREATMAQQVLEIASQHQYARIGVLAGSAHTPIYHRLVGKSALVEHRYADKDTLYVRPPNRITFDPLSQLSRHAMFFPETPLPEAMVGRALLYLTHDAAVIRRLAYDPGPVHHGLERLSGAEIKEVLAAVEATKATMPILERPGQALTDADALIVQAAQAKSPR